MHDFQINVLIVAMYILSPAAAPVASASALSSFVCCSSLHQQFLSSDRKAEHHIGFITLVEVGFLCRHVRPGEHNNTHFWLMPGHGGAGEEDRLPHATYYDPRLLWVSRLQIIIISFTTVINSLAGASLARINATTVDGR